VPVTRGFKGILLGFATTALACGELSTTPGADAGTPGSTRTPCPTSGCAGAFVCSAGECVPPCLELNFECADADRYCFERSRCEPRKRPTCAAQPCVEGQVCRNGVCADLTLRPCEVNTDCASGDTCATEAGRCAASVPCDDDGTCHAGTEGAACLLADSSLAIPVGYCAVAWCRSNRDCPESKTCVEIGAIHASLGVCR